ncbi:MAG: hypothetical protein ACQETJ_09490 [Bacteroidota bacterium]
MKKRGIKLIERPLPFICCIIFLLGCSNVKNGTLEFVKADEENGFHYPYFLFTPDKTSTDSEIPIIVEPNNSGFLDDDLKAHIEKAERTPLPPDCIAWSLLSLVI